MALRMHRREAESSERAAQPPPTNDELPAQPRATPRALLTPPPGGRVQVVRSPLTVAAVQPECPVGDLAGAAEAHGAAVRAADARVVVFPEMSLTGYELQAPAVAPEDPALMPLVAACAASGAIAFAGAPISDGKGRDFIAVLRVDDTGVQVAYRKTWLGGDEPARFSAGPGPVVETIDGWRWGLAICKDTGAAQHTAALATMGIDVYVAGLVHHPEERPEQEARAVVVARACRAYVVFASFAGPTGGGYSRTAGGSAIWSAEGSPIARAGLTAGGMARSILR